MGQQNTQKMRSVGSRDLSSITDTLANDAAKVIGRHSHELRASPIYGRSKEQLQLLKAFVDVLSTKKSRTVLLHGCSGSGKTALVEQFRESISQLNRGLFCSGKYFQDSVLFQEPFSAVMAAFSDLCDLIVQSMDHMTEERKVQIRRDLAMDANLLRKVISNISPLLEENITNVTRTNHYQSLSSYSSVDYFRTDAASAKFKMACKAFLRAMSCGDTPIVVFLDDIQWMDEGSRQLIRLYLNDLEIRNVLFILAYRDEDKDTVHKCLEHVLDRNDFEEVALGMLSHDDVGQMIGGMLQSPQAMIQDLSNLVVKKTLGNPFFILQFMESIEREGFLEFHSESKSWLYNVDAIQKGMMVADSIVDLLLQKIEMISHDERQLLQVASLLGYHFDSVILAKLATRLRKNHNTHVVTPELLLSKSVEFGIVEKTKDGFQFSHDKLQSSFKSMISCHDKKHLHLVIGEVFLAHDDAKSYYFAAVHLNQAIAKHDANNKQLLQLAEINLKAAKYCQEKSSFDGASRLLRHCLSLLDGDEKWRTNFDLSFEATELLARMELIIGNLRFCKELLRETLHHATSVAMKTNSLLMDVECALAGNELGVSIDTAYNALGVLGIPMPRRVTKGHVAMKVLQVRRMLHGKEDEEILSMSPMQDSLIIAAVKILSSVAFSTVLRGEASAAVFSALLATKLTLRFGLSPHSGSTFVFYAIVENHLKNLDRATRFGKLGIKLIAQYDCKESESTAISTWVTSVAHLTQDLIELREPLARAIQSGFLTGDPIYTALSMANAFAVAYQIGDNLSNIEAFMRNTYSQLCDLSHDEMILWVQPRFQFILNLQREDVSDWRQLSILSGEIMNEDILVQKAADAMQPTLKLLIQSIKAQLAYLFNFIEDAEDLYKDMIQIVHKGYFLNFTSYFWFLFGSLTYYERYQVSNERHHVKTARKWQRTLQKIQATGNPNVPYISLLQAEEASLKKSSSFNAVLSMYDHAIRTMSEDNLCHMEALANERAGFFCIRDDEEHIDAARRYFGRALELYKHKWGGIAKHDSLKEKVEMALGPRSGHRVPVVESLAAFVLDVTIEAT